MKKHFRLIISTFCLGVLLFAAFILAVNLYVQSRGVQNRIRLALSEAVGMPVNVFRTTFSPWGGFRLDQIKIASDLPLARADFLKADLLEVRCELAPLFKGQIVLKRIALDAPQFVFQKNALGQFRLPLHSGKIVVPPPTPGLGATGPALPPGSRPTPPVPTEVVELKPGWHTSDLNIRKLLLRDGHFRFLAADGSELLRLETVRCSLHARPLPNTFTGVLEIKKIVVLNRLEITGLEATVILDHEKLTIEKLGADLAEGRLEGGAEADLGVAGQPYSVRLRLNKGDLAKFFPANSDLANELVGLVHARLEYDGFATQEEKNKGHAELKISHAKISQMPLLQIISQLGNTGEVGNLSIKKTEVKADITGPLVQITPSYLESNHLRVTFSGPMDAAQKLDLKAQLAMDESLFKKLPSEARENFVKAADLDQQVLDFVITGPISAPQTNLVNRLVGDKLQRKLKSFLGDYGDESATPTPSPQK